MKIKTLKIYSLSILAIMLAVVSVQAFQMDNSSKPVEITVKSLKKKGYTCEVVSLGFTSCEKCTTDSKGEKSCIEYWCSSGSCVKQKGSSGNSTRPDVRPTGPVKKVSLPNNLPSDFALDKLREIRREILATSTRKLKRKQKANLTKAIDVTLKALQDRNGQRAVQKFKEFTALARRNGFGFGDANDCQKKCQHHLDDGNATKYGVCWWGCVLSGYAPITPKVKMFSQPRENP